MKQRRKRFRVTNNDSINLYFREYETTVSPREERDRVEEFACEKWENKTNIYSFHYFCVWPVHNVWSDSAIEVKVLHVDFVLPAIFSRFFFSFFTWTVWQLAYGNEMQKSNLFFDFFFIVVFASSSSSVVHRAMTFLCSSVRVGVCVHCGRIHIRWHQLNDQRRTNFSSKQMTLSPSLFTVYGQQWRHRTPNRLEIAFIKP